MKLTGLQSPLLVAAAGVSVQYSPAVNMNRRQMPVAKADGRSTRGGVALVLVLLLVGVIATLTINVQTSIALVHRHMQMRRLRTELRMAASDNAWCFLRDRVKPMTGGGALPAAERTVLPSGVETSVSVTDSTDAFLGAIPFIGSKSGSDRIYLLQATATDSNVTERVSCIYSRNRSGLIEVLGWHQEM